MEDDATQFHKVITARKARNEAKDVRVKSEQENIALEELRVATDMPIIVAKHCLRLTECAIFIFDNGYQAVRGDSSVAINGALSAVGGALSIINLNLLSYTSDSWTAKIRQEADFLGREYDRLLLEAAERQKDLKQESDALHLFHLELNRLKGGLQLNPDLSVNQIENFVSGFQNLIWNNRDTLWKSNVPEEHLSILDPKTLLKKLGYQYMQTPSLGHHEIRGDVFEVAGMIDSSKKYVAVAEKFSPETINFTIAHELGHALLHPNEVLHRDRPLDGSHLSSKDFKEKQADKFAACFLMPKKQVTEMFSARFSSKNFQINEQAALGLGFRINDLRKRCREIRDLSILLASTTYFNRPFNSLAKQFGVSENAMAIRLEELGLVNKDNAFM